MRSLSSNDGGVIAPEAALAAADASAKSALSAVPSDYAGQSILDVPLLQLPSDTAEISEPALHIAQKISDDANGALTSPAGLSGLGGGNSVQAQDILSGISDPSSLLTGAESAISQATTNAYVGVQSAANQVNAALTGGSLGTGTSSTGTGTASAATSITDDPVSALLSGVQLPALPGIDTLIQPITSLLSSFGTGVFGSLDPTTILSNSSSAISTAMSVAQSGLKTVESLWEGKSADSASTSSTKAQSKGADTSQNGVDISSLTQKAAAVVQSGNAQLSAIVTTFATQAAALAPTIMLPPTQAALITLATEHLGEAVTVVNATRGELAGHTAALTGIVQQIAASSGLPSVQEVASAVSSSGVGDTLLTKAQEALTGSTDNKTTAANTNGTTPTTPASTTPSSLGTGGSHGGGGTSGGLGGSLSGLTSGKGGTAGTPSAGTPKASGLPSGAMPAGRLMGANGAMGGTGTNGQSMMGSPAGAAAGKGNGNDEHTRTVAPYQSRVGNDDLTGPLGESTPEVIGDVHEDERDPDEDRF